MSKYTRELITLQVGHYANFVGTHWWNLQEASFVYDGSKKTDINHDFLFRDGMTPQRQETYTPRLLAIDMKGNLGSLPLHGSLYTPLQPSPSTAEALWDGRVDLVRQLEQEKNEYLQDLEMEESRYFGYCDEDKDVCMEDVNSPTTTTKPSEEKIYNLNTQVKVWSDYLRPHLHPNAVYLLDEHLVQSGRVAGEGGEYGFMAGVKVFQREEVEDEVTDRIRLLAESCGSLQGFQVITDSHNAFGGLSQAILQHLQDEYGTKDSITFACTPPHVSPHVSQARAVVQTAVVQTYAELTQLSSLVVPLNLRSCLWDLKAPMTPWPHLALQEDNPYISSSVLACFLESATTIYRSRDKCFPLAAVADVLTPAGRKMAGGSLCLPPGLEPDSHLLEWLTGHQPRVVSVSGGFDPREEPLNGVQVLRGFRGNRLVRSDTRLPPGVSYSSAGEVWEQWLSGAGGARGLQVVGEARDPLALSAPFPHVFNNNVTSDGYVASTPLNVKAVTSCSSVGGLHQGASMGGLLQKVIQGAERVDVARAPQLLDEGLDKDAWLGHVEALRSLQVNYCGRGQDVDSSDDD